jgi:hypothetical protein
MNSQQITICVSLILWIQNEALLDTSKIKFIGDFFSGHDIHVVAYVTCSTPGKLNFVCFCIRISEENNRTRH